ncbi:MAG: threonyl-tRNA synthetase editing domain-containing protein [Candidatus Thorarchaeota archaeon]|nr:threonyl-tRNA synthetase editing domain-containing protein [Candidatus Thorarchaeota archaeon]
MFHLESFWFRRNESEDARTQLGESVLVWIHSEVADLSNHTSVLRKMVKNIRWLSQKVSCNRIILHSFAHLDESKAESDFAAALINEVADKLQQQGFEIHMVPFGHFFEFDMHVKGPSLAKVFKQF